MDEDEDDLGVEMPDDLNKQLLAVMGSLSGARKRESQLRQQQLQQATEALKQRRYGPSMAEQMFALSSAFAQPVQRRGLGSVLGNVMPVLGAGATAARTGQTAQADDLRALQDKYALGEIGGERGSVEDQFKMLEMGIKMRPKVEKPVVLADSLGRGVITFDRGSGKASLVRTPEGGSDLPTPKTREEMLKLPPGTPFKAPDGSLKVTPGGPTASQSGDF